MADVRDAGHHRSTGREAIHKPAQHRERVAQMLEHIAEHQDVRHRPPIQEGVEGRVIERLNVGAQHSIQDTLRRLGGIGNDFDCRPEPSWIAALPSCAQCPSAASQLQNMPG
jgi:hypothetical protein